MLSTSGYPPYLHAGQGLTLSRPVAFGDETSYTSRHLANAASEHRLMRSRGTQFHQRSEVRGDEPCIVRGAGRRARCGAADITAARQFDRAVDWVLGNR